MYLSQVRDNNEKVNSDRLESNHIEAARIVTGSTNNDSGNSILNEA